jgi:hypothetical protein
MTDASNILPILHSVDGKFATKRFNRHPKTGKLRNKSYDRAYQFRVELRPVNNLDVLYAALVDLGRMPHAFVIRGEPLPSTNLHYTKRRFRPHGNEPATFAAAARRWFAVDMDHIPAAPLTDPITDPEGTADYLKGLLPRETHDVSCICQFTSSQSLPRDDGTLDTDYLSGRLWFRSAVPLRDADLKRWSAHHNEEHGRVIDPVLYHPIQAHYTCAPIFADGITDPLPQRLVMLRGLDDEVSLLIPPPDPKNPELASSEGYAPGLGIGAYLAEIGGGRGFHEPIKSAVASFIAIYGSRFDAEGLKKAIRAAIDAADPGGRDAGVIERYKSDAFLDGIITGIRKIHGDRPPKGWTQPPPRWLDLPPPAEPDDDYPPSLPILRPVVQVPAGQLPATVDAAEAILIESDRNLYEFGDQVVRPARAPIKIADSKTTIGLRLVPVRLHHMIERFTRCIEFRKFYKKERQWVPVDCPEAVAKTYLERVGLWRLPKLTALSSCPLLLREGRIVERPGFDARSGILFDPQGIAFPPVPTTPSQDDARLALADIKALFREFPFVDDRARSVLLSALLTSVSRLAYDFAPLHGFDAPVAGTGKSKLVNCCVILVNGHECPVISQGDDETEFEKRLGAELLEGSRMISIDNCDLPLGGPLLCQTATQHFIKVRVLGFSKSVLIVNSAMLFATGNNLKLYGDMLRRGLICRLDAGEERPELRTFEQEDPEHVLKRERGRYAVAALTVLRAYIVAGQPIRRQPLGGFEGWSELVRNALIWLGEDDPVETIETARAEDPERQHLEAVVIQWHAVLADRSVTTQAVIDEARAMTLERGTGPDYTDRHVFVRPEFRNALLDVAGERGRISPPRLGTWIGRNKHKVVGKHRLAVDTDRGGRGRWKLETLDDDGKWR